MKLKQITFTGIDHRTNLDALELIQRSYPFVEFGVLLSTDWKANGNRYFNPQFLPVFEHRTLRLSAHLCGALARYAVRNKWEKVYEVTGEYFHVFDRCQLNIAGRKDNPEMLETRVPYFLNEVIIQQKSADDCELWRMGKTVDEVTMLLDASGGQGIDTPIKVLETQHFKIGYAGGINEFNVAEKLDYLLSNDKVGDFWIDMESGVRSHDWFDTNKVWNVLAECDKVFTKHNIRY